MGRGLRGGRTRGRPCFAIRVARFSADHILRPSCGKLGRSILYPSCRPPKVTTTSTRTEHALTPSQLKGAKPLPSVFISLCFLAALYFLGGPLLKGPVSCLSWNWRERSSVKITERTHAKRAEALHCRGE